MESDINQGKTAIEEIELRLLGYYNDPGQWMDDETEEPERAQQLASLLAQTFDTLDDPNDDPAFKNAVNNGVFILKDQESRLYAYFHKERKARVNGVLFNRDNLAQLPLVYKYWFKPGEKLNIAPQGTANIQNMSFFDYLRQPERIGKQVVLTTDFLPKGFNGELVAVGRDFLSITDSQGQTFVISKHICVQLDLPLLQKPKENVPLLQLEVSAMGYIESYDQQKGRGWVITYGGERLGLAGTSLLDPKLHERSQVVFTRYPAQGVVTSTHLAYANYVHSPGPVDDILRLALQLRRQKKRQETIEVLKHILDEYPDHAEAGAMFQEMNGEGKQPELDPDTVEFNRANSIITDNDDKKEAVKIYESLLKKGKKVKDCIMRIASTYQALYEETENPEEKDIYKRKLLDHISQYHTKLSPAASLTFRLQNFLKLGDDKLYYDLVDSELAETETNTDNTKRGKMLYFKALYMSQSESVLEKEKASELAEESLFINPFNNKAELLWLPAKEYVGDTLTVPNGKSRYAQALLSKGLKDGVDENIDWMKRLNQTDKYFAHDNESNKGTVSDYATLLLNAALSGRAVNNSNQDVTDQLLTEYMSYKARELAGKGNLDSAIYLWSELFAIVPGMGYFVQANLSAMMSAVLSQGISDSVYTSWQEVLSNAIDITPQQWEQILYAISTNPDVLKAVDQHIMGNARLTATWETYADATGHEGSPQEVVADFPRKAFEDSAVNKIGEMHKNIPDLTDKLTALSAADFSLTPFIQLSATEQDWLNRLTDECRPLINQYLITDNVKERLQKAGKIKEALDSIASIIIDTPTSFGMRGLIPLINSITSNFDRVADTSTNYTKPQLTLNITSEYVSKGTNGFYRITGTIMNSEDAGDAEDIKLTIPKNKKSNFAEIKKQMLSIARLQGGGKNDFFFDIKLKPAVEQRESFGFSIMCSYKYKKEEYTQAFNPLQCRLGQPQVFEKIETCPPPYTYGTSLKVGDMSFKGRKDEIRDITEYIMHPHRTSQQIIIYGQKRCGKSTLADAVKSNLETNYKDKAFCVSFQLTHDTKLTKTYTEADFFFAILKAIMYAVIGCKETEKPQVNFPTEEEMAASDAPLRLFTDAIVAFKQSMAQTPGWEERRLVVIIDEFTTLYNDIKSGWTSPAILHNWKAIQETNSPANFATIFVGHDIAPKFLNEEFGKNASAIIEHYPLGYLDEQSACELIVDPIRDKDGRSRFEDKAIKRILYYTSSNPSYIQRFMMKMVDYINDHEIVKVSAIDVEEVAQGFIKKEYTDFLTIDNFDDLINSGLESKYSDIKDSQFVEVLRIIARLTKSTEYCKRVEIENEVGKLQMNEHNVFIMKHLDEILEDLDVRRVIKRQDNNENIKIIIGLFKEWLNQN